MATQTPTSIDAYISSCPENAQAALKKVRAVIRKAAPQAEEVISYGLAAWRQESMLVFLGGWEKHLGFYPASREVFKAFARELAGFPQTGKGTVHFPLDKPMPVRLIAAMVKFRVNENLARKGKGKGKGKKPVTKKDRKPAAEFLAALGAPARRALEGAGLTGLAKLAKRSEAEVLKLHGMGPASLPKLRAALKGAGLSFRKK